MVEPDPKAHRFHEVVPHGDDRQRLVCTDCGWIHYVNPKIVVGAVVARGDELLLCRRAIEPRRGYWTMPAGFMEAGEDTDAGARREAYEEALATIETDALIGIYSIARLSQVHLIYRAKLVSDFAAGPESLEVKLFRYADVPWDDLAFPTVHWALRHYHATRELPAFPPFRQPAGDADADRDP
jgi:ADP-ribose pyrophosphatase YjhB (NUDIX family)